MDATRFSIVRLAHRSVSPLGETFLDMLQEADADLTTWDKKTATRVGAVLPWSSPPSRAFLFDAKNERACVKLLIGGQPC